MKAKIKCSTRITIRHRCNKTKHQWPHQIGMEESEIKTQEQVPIPKHKMFFEYPKHSPQVRTVLVHPDSDVSKGRRHPTSTRPEAKYIVPKSEDCKCEDASVTTHSQFRQCGKHTTITEKQQMGRSGRIRRFSDVVSSELSYTGLYFLQAHAHTKEWYAPAHTTYLTKPQLQSKGMTSEQSSSS